ncbi:YqcI/YcgG family protein [Paenibacillus sp. JX-17]|uniref:YqcI/YcgG family protein n=1 Tax=Paenibacillus lacisoli TaxID=3064525 RepID=A0ABT9C9M7_9BACL|nr:YqcI/YcgG family protein [Paenibacillus sp. JX-17]MDO7905575.1 YqcI/YcgG family protein [Paenibacillus sp. JX-17]
MPLLFQYRDIVNEELPLEDWKKEACLAFASKMSNREARFPCIPATHAFAQGHLRYSFVSHPWSGSAGREMAEILAEYGRSSRSFGDYSSLVIFFEPEEEIRSVLEYENVFWSLLSDVSQLDSMPWPEDIPEDPHQPMWEFCYEDERYFVYCGTPAHHARQSRSFPYFMLALTPRWVLTRWNANPQKAAAIAPRIRSRLKAYDAVPAHPELKQYGAQGNLEYKQYFLRDDDTSPGGCPFHRAALKARAEDETVK